MEAICRLDLPTLLITREAKAEVTQMQKEPNTNVLYPAKGYIISTSELLFDLTKEYCIAPGLSNIPVMSTLLRIEHYSFNLNIMINEISFDLENGICFHFLTTKMSAARKNMPTLGFLSNNHYIKYIS